MSRQNYASELTKDFLMQAGITWVDMSTLTVYGQDGPRNPIINRSGYLMIAVYDLDKDGNKIKLPRLHKYKKKNGTYTYTESYVYKTKMIGLHRILWAWKYGRIPEGYIIDHKNNKHYELGDYAYDNLQCITQAENLAKDKLEQNTRLVKPAKNKTIEYYQIKLNKALIDYEQAKKDHDAVKAHRKRSLISLQKAKIRYLLSLRKENDDRHVEEIKLY